ncbi:MAG TPA: CBS domain-containing protein [Anaerolineae bacterium]|nr:CBS domain-containing protein [Anaerolineae bacterium]
MTVRDILKGKGSIVYSIPPSATVLDALQAMADHNIGAILVMQAGKVLGIFSERDHARRVVLQNKSESTKITEVMTEDIYFVSPQNTAEECMAQMTDKHIRHLPVVEDDKVVGVISIGDLVKAQISHQQDLIRNLENYIMGRDYNR